MERPIRSWVGLNQVILAYQWFICLVFGQISGIVCVTAQVMEGAGAPQSSHDSINDCARFNVRPKKG